MKEHQVNKFSKKNTFHTYIFSPHSPQQGIISLFHFREIRRLPIHHRLPHTTHTPKHSSPAHTNQRHIETPPPPQKKFSPQLFEQSQFIGFRAGMSCTGCFFQNGTREMTLLHKRRKFTFQRGISRPSLPR